MHHIHSHFLMSFLLLIIPWTLFANPLSDHSSVQATGAQQSHSQQTNIHTTITIDQVRYKINQQIQKLQAKSPHAKVRANSSQLSPRLLLGLQLPITGASITQKAQTFISQYSDLWYGVQIKIKEVTERKGRHTVHLLGWIKGQEILNQDSKMSFNTEGLLVNLVNGLDAIYQVKDARITAQQAQENALKHMNLAIDHASIVTSGFIVQTGEAIAVFDVSAYAVPLQHHYIVRVNGVDGSILSVHDRVRR